MTVSNNSENYQKKESRVAPPKGRPKTEAAAYVSMLIRMPAALAEDLRARAARDRRPLNTQAIMWLEYARQHDPAAPTTRRPRPG
jgi:hypothetical protein